jgi:hypothetical protein
MSPSTSKKVLVRRFDREVVAGFVSPHSYLQAAGIEVLTPSGTMVVLPYREVKSVCFVKEFEGASQAQEHKVFNTRPKMEGLWVRLNFRDNEIMDGILPNNLLQIDRYGFTIVPPEPYSNNQRIFVPREALNGIQVLGVVGSPLTRGRRKTVAKEQGTLFE